MSNENENDTTLKNTENGQRLRERRREKKQKEKRNVENIRKIDKDCVSLCELVIMYLRLNCETCLRITDYNHFIQ